MFFMSVLGNQFLYIFCAICLTSVSHSQRRMTSGIKAENENFLPFGSYQSLNSIQKSPKDNDTLTDEVKDLTLKVRDTVKDIAAHRNMQCFGDPCLLQIFPIVYNIPDSGFFGGARAKVTNVSRIEPALYSIESYVIRSDTQQWLTYLYLDAPQIEWLPTKPRVKARTFYSRVTERRFYGTENNFEETFEPDSRFRYSLEEVGLQSSLIIPLFNLGQQRINTFGSFSYVRHRPKTFDSLGTSKLFEVSPTGISGGRSNRIGAGFQIDSRDKEVLTRKGWSLEVSGELSRRPISQYDFSRISLIDRRYFTKGPFTVANRMTFDFIMGSPPFWELEGVGGIDPVSDVTNSTLFRGLLPGRYHENIKIIENLEFRWHFRPTRFFGLHTEPVLLIAAIDAGRFGRFNDISGSTGMKFLVNRSLQIQTYFSYSKYGFDIWADFGQEF